MRISVNGAARELGAGQTVAELVAELAGDGRGIAVAIDGSVLPRGQWSLRTLRDGDSVELLTAVQGG